MNSVLTSNNIRATLCGRPSTLPEKRIGILKNNYSFSLHEFIADIKEDWDSIAIDEEFAKSDYLQVIEDTSVENLANLYVRVYNSENQLIGIILLQRLILEISKSFRYEQYSTDRSWTARKIQQFRQAVMSLFTFRMLTVGNLYLTGQYGFSFKEELISVPEQFKLVKEVLKKARRELCSTAFRFSGILYKDYFENQRPMARDRKSFKEFRIDPNMILDIQTSWNHFDDYLLDMRSKYRIRMKNAMRKFNGVERRELSTEDLRVHFKTLYMLYDELLSNSGFVLAKGTEDYFLRLKEGLGDRLKITAYFLNNEIVGFYSWVKEKDKLDSHFIGFSSQLNLKYQLYLNILLDLVRDSIEQKVQHLYLFRTALEIKSSIGAVPHEMYCYFKHANPIINRLFIKPLFGYFVPHQQWMQRHPFKALDAETNL